MRGGTLFTISHHMNPLPGKRIYVSDNFHVQVSKIYEACKWNVSVYRLNKKSNENKRYLYTFEIRILCSLFYRVCVAFPKTCYPLMVLNGIIQSIILSTREFSCFSSIRKAHSKAFYK